MVESADDSLMPRFARRTAWSFGENALSARLAAAKAGPAPVFDLTLSNPLKCGFDLSGLGVASSFDREGLLDYSPDPWGLLSAREEVCRYYAARGAAVDPRRVMLTASTSDAYNYIFRLLCDPGDEVLAPAPSYPLFSFLADVNDVVLRPYALLYDGVWRLDREAFKDSLSGRTKAVVVVGPNNPTGSFMRAADMDFMRSAARERGLAIICDEVFGDYALDAAPDAVRSLAGDSDVLTFVLSGLSKILAMPQMKLAWMLVQGEGTLAEAACRRLEIIADTFLSVNTPVQLAFGAWMEKRELVQRPLMDRLRGNMDALRRMLEGQWGLEALRVEGGWYAVLRMEGVLGEERFCLGLLDECGVAVHPGYFYDFASGAHLVLSLLTPPEAWTEGLSRLVDYHRRKSF
ncbi:MAG: pyridoxal phosphate-dependent aminotransferase [Opitutales bacterium]|jgi:aspartate/methionine/tyrosine aminotransferase